MARDINEFIAELPEERRRNIEEGAAQLIAEEMARSLHIAQKQICEIEKRTDMHISTLRRTIEAMGGELTLTAKFPNHAPVVLTGFAALDA